MQHASVDLRWNAPTTVNYLAQKPTCYETRHDGTAEHVTVLVQLIYILIVSFLINRGFHTLPDVQEDLQNTEGTSNDQVDWDVMFLWTLSQVDAT